ncbi:helix-turn-helix domain-containing protein [Microvirga sp. W0021]|uniref:Helix-turn-helix domain-containing protein n=1 Tax=Hohaiivirga grylli TaxID=3133970 RepID=A0ABV0BGV4_9HYPH
MTKIKKSEIVDIARKLFQENGYHGASMGDVAMASGLQKGSLYSHFSGKDELANAALELTLCRLTDRYKPTGNWQKDFLESVRVLTEYLKIEKRCIGLHFLYDLNTCADAVHVRQFFKGIKNHLVRILHNGLDADNADQLAEDALTIIEGATIWQIINNNDASMDRAVSMVQMLLAAKIANHGNEEPLSSEAVAILERYGKSKTLATHVECRLAEELAQTNADMISLRGALAGQIEAESCFL